MIHAAVQDSLLCALVALHLLVFCAWHDFDDHRSRRLRRGRSLGRLCFEISMQHAAVGRLAVHSTDLACIGRVRHHVYRANFACDARREHAHGCCCPWGRRRTNIIALPLSLHPKRSLSAPRPPSLLYHGLRCYADSFHPRYVLLVFWRTKFHAANFRANCACFVCGFCDRPGASYFGGFTKFMLRSETSRHYHHYAQHIIVLRPYLSKCAVFSRYLSPLQQH